MSICKKSKTTTKQRKIVSDKQKVYSLVSRIYKELKNNQNISFKKLRGCQGEYDGGNDEITIDYRKEVLSTMVHEFIHKFYPDRCERWVINQERFIMRRLSPQQAKKLLIFLLYIV